MASGWQLADKIKEAKHALKQYFALDHRRRLVTIYSLILVLSLITFVGGNAVLIRQNIHAENQNFQHLFSGIHQSLVQSFAVNETILDGFAAFLAEVGMQDPNRARYYSQTMMDRYPHIYMFQAAQRVPSERVAEFEQAMSLKLGEPLLVRRFEFGQGLVPAAESTHTDYFPLVFVEPTFSDGLNILGLDISSIHFVKEAMEKARATGLASLSQPIELIEGQQAFVMVKPSFQAGQKEPSQYALLILETEALLQKEKLNHAGLQLKLSVGGEFNLLEIETPKLTTWEENLFPIFIEQRQIKMGSETLTLEFTHQIGTMHLNWPLISILLVISVVAVFVVIQMLQIHLHSERMKYEANQRLYRQANYDNLTGLANRNHFEDSFTRSMVSTLRRQDKIALLYMDLNDFKKVNDTFGHQVGDKMLMIAAGIILDVIRADDLASRFGGDEFVIMLENVEDREDALRVVNNIHQCFNRVNLIDGHSVKLKASIGVAIFPDDATSIEHLIKVADQHMYEQKQAYKQENKISRTG